MPKWLLVISSLTGMEDLSRETVFHEFSTQAACQVVENRLSRVFLYQNEALNNLFENELPGVIRPYNYSVVFCVPIENEAISRHEEPDVPGDFAVNFECIWGDGYAVTIRFDPISMTADRSDGGSAYEVIDASPDAIWLRLLEPSFGSIGMQMIERSAGGEMGHGVWQDVIWRADGTRDTISGGRCVEIGR